MFFSNSTSPIRSVALLLLPFLLFFALSPIQTTAQEAEPGLLRYILYGPVADEAKLLAVLETGTTLERVGHDWAEVTSTPENVLALEALGFRVEPLPTTDSAPAVSSPSPYKVYLPLILTAGSPTSEPDFRDYLVKEVSNKFQRTEIARLGVDITGVDLENNSVTVLATPAELEAIQALGYTLEPIPPSLTPLDFPAEDSGYHNYAEMVAEINQAALDHANIVSLFSIGQSYEGRELWAAKLSDNPTQDEDEPEVLFTFHLHAREHLTVEQGLYILQILTDEYATTPRINNIINTLEIYMVFDVNPDGGEFDHATGEYVRWRKNRQPNQGSSAIGTDLNRNWDYQWGCCGGSGTSPGSSTYRGPAPFSAPESNALRNFVESRVIDNQQQIAAHIDFHTRSEFVVYPYGYYAANDIPPDMTVDDYNLFLTLAGNMASLNRYTPIKSGDIYQVDGTINDWMYGRHNIISFLFELYPVASDPAGFYPDDEIIPAETARNREAILYFLDLADCPYRVIGAEQQLCGLDPTEPGIISLSDLRGYWSLDELTGQRFDQSGLENRLVENNTVAAVTGQVGLAAHFEADNDEYLSIADANQTGLGVNGSFTLLGWMRPESLGVVQVMAGKYEFGTVNRRAYRLDLRQDNSLGFLVSPNGSLSNQNILEVAPPTPLVANTWYHLAGVFDASEQTLSLYLDGELIGSQVVNFNTVYNTTAPFMLGANLQNGQPTQFFDGELDEWYLFGQALSESEIDALMSSQPPEPITGLTATNNGPTPLGATTTLTATITGGSNVAYAWSFGDGNSGTGATVSHSYATTGTFTALVTASNSTGLISATTEVIIEAAPPDEPITGLTATSDGPTPVGSPTQLTAALSGGTNVSYSWDLGDGNSAGGATVNHTYAAPGSFTATVTASNGLGSAIASTLVTIQELPPIASFTSSSPDTLGDPTTFTNTSTGSNLSYQWAFGDGNTSSAQNPTHTYSAVGSYTVVLTVSNALASAITSDQVLITEPVPQPTSLVAAWSLDETAALRLDTSPNANHLTALNGVGSAPGQVGYAADLEANSSHYLAIDDAAQAGLDLSANLTLAGWINPESLNTWQIVAAKYAFDGENNRAYRLDLRTNDRIGFIISPNGKLRAADNLLEASLPTPLSAGQWYHLAAVFDSSARTMSIYLDGSPIASRSVSYNSIFNSTAPFTLGTNFSSGSPSQFFDGQLDDWRVYADALSQTDIQTLMTGQTPPDEPITGLTATSDGPTPVGSPTLSDE